jgi:hypothetical protein
VDRSLDERGILGGFFAQVDQIWRGNGQELRSLEILSYDPVKEIHSTSGFSRNGSTWARTATCDNATTIEDGRSNARTIEEGITKSPDGQVSACHTTWIFNALSSTQECEQNGVRWTAFRFKGTKSTTAR